MELWLRNRRIDPSAFPQVMGILNVTPDSFSDGGEHLAPGHASARALGMIAAGADIIDVGPESTRPGAQGVPADEQIRRAIPVIEAIRAENDAIPISIDTRLAPVAQAALRAGADVINDVSALGDDPAMSELAATTGAPIILMHRKGTSATMQQGGGPHYHDVISEICTYLSDRVQHAVSCGIDAQRIIIDPGIGFGKRVEDNLMILRHVDRFVAMGQPVLVGASRKSFLGKVPHSCQARVGEDGVEEATSRVDSVPHDLQDGPKNREAGSLACAAIAVMAGACIIRTHDIRPTVEVIRLCTAVRDAT